VTWDPRRLPSQAGKTFVVTGGSSGIGYFICEQLADAGATVVIAARNEAKADAAIAAIRSRVPGADIRFVLLDLGSFESIRTAAGQLMQLERIDGLIENAGAIMPSKSRLETVDGSEIMFGTNHLGHFLLTALLYPELKKTPGSRVVTMGSGSTRLTTIDLDNLQGTRNYSSWRSYGQSKHATQAFGFELDRRLRAAGSSVMSLVAHPGGAQDGNSPYREGVLEPSRRERLAAKLMFFIGGGKDAGAWPVVRAATDPDAVGGQYWGPHRGLSGRPEFGKPSPVSHDERLGRELWSRTEAFVGQRFEL
jgi:NAD(P)-dependent dehydrogenase (short-subunit alcohol dehydrogenase family)